MTARRPVARQVFRGVLFFVVAYGALSFLVRGPPASSQREAGTLAFAAFGDAPYNRAQGLRYQIVLDDIAAHDLDVVVHIGDLFSGNCGTERYEERAADFARLPHPVVYTPGDNEWTDCWRPSGGMDPLERLEALRQVFFGDPSQSLGGRPMSLESQAGDDQFAEFRENARWVAEGVVFSTVHVVGSRNGKRSFPNETAEDTLEANRRSEAAVRWVGEAFSVATASAAAAVVISFHAEPGFRLDPGDRFRTPYEPLLNALRDGARVFGGPVLVVHGDQHNYTVDQPVRGAPNLTRLQVPGSPDVGWVRVTIDPTAEPLFHFERRVVPLWKLW